MHGRSAAFICFALAMLALAAGNGACCPSVFYEITAPEPTVRLPLDEAPHECGGFEWWYYTGRVVTDDGHGYGIEAVIFHIPRVPLAPLGEVWIAHYAVLDEAGGSFVYDQARSLGPSIIPGAPREGFDLSTPLVQMTGAGGEDRLSAAMADGAYALDLTLSDEHGAILHGADGYVPYGPTGSSFYYSRPRMPATGTMEVAEQPRTVRGHLWFDRQWGRSLKDPWLSWDWFSLRLDDGTDVMLFAFHDPAAPVSCGTYIPNADEPLSLTGDEFTIIPTAWWTSPHTAITYPVAWEIRVVPHELNLTVTAVAEDQELDVRATTLNVYWEGLCTITGTHVGQSVAGHAYVELANYSR